MKNEWFIDVLSDLRAFAEANDLSAVAAKLDELCLTAEAEMLGCASARGPEMSARHEAARSGRLH